MLKKGKANFIMECCSWTKLSIFARFHAEIVEISNFERFCTKLYLGKIFLVFRSLQISKTFQIKQTLHVAMILPNSDCLVSVEYHKSNVPKHIEWLPNVKNAYIACK